MTLSLRGHFMREMTPPPYMAPTDAAEASEVADTCR